MSVSGVADAIHIATYYIGNILIEANERMPSYQNSSYRPSSMSRTSRTAPGGYQGSSYVPGGAYQQAGAGAPAPYHGGPPAHAAAAAAATQQLQTQQIYIPNDMVGAIIGKGGAKINEIRHLSGSVIKINEPQDNSNERLVTITGTAECNQMALYMLYSRLGT